MRVGFFASCLALLGLSSFPASAPADDAPPDPTRQELLDPDWIETTLTDVGTDRLIKLYDQDEAAEPDATVRLVQDALRASRTFLNRHPEELRSQLQARLLTSDDPELLVFQDLPADRVRARMIRPSLIQAGDALERVVPLRDQGNNLVASPDGSLIAHWAARMKLAPTVDRIAGIEVRSGLTGEEIAFVTLGEEGYLVPAGISPNCEQVFGITQDGRIHAWDIATSEILWTGVGGITDQHRAECEFSSDGGLVAVSVFGSHVSVLNVETGEGVAVLRAEGVTFIGDIAFIDDDTIAGCCNGGVLRHWSIESGEVIEEFEVAAAYLTSDGLTAVGLDGKSIDDQFEVRGITVIDAVTGEMERQFEIAPLHLNYNAGLDFAEEQVLFPLLGSLDASPRLLGYSLATGEKLTDVDFSGYDFFHHVPLPGNRVVMCGIADHLSFWDMTRVRPESIANDRARRIAISNDGATAMSSDYGYVRLWDTQTWQERTSFTLPGYSHLADMSADATQIVYSENHEIFRIDVATGQTSSVYKIGDGEQSIRALQLSGDGEVVVATIARDRTYVIDAVNGQLLHSTEFSWEIDIDYAGDRVLLGRRLLDVSTGDEFEFMDVSGEVNALSGDGSLGIITSFWSGNSVWDLSTSEILKDAAHEFEADWVDDTALAVALSHNGRFSASCDVDFNIHLYDTQAGMHLATVATDSSGIKSLALSDTGENLLVLTSHGIWHHFRFENLPP